MMFSRRQFCKKMAIAVPFAGIAGLHKGDGKPRTYDYPPEAISDFCRNLKPVNSILETEGYYVWCVAENI